jgi:hypothetical protein
MPTHRKLNLAIIGTALLLAAGRNSTYSCGHPLEPGRGTLEISFLFNKAVEVVPSYQIAIWLESEDGKYVKPLFVSEYLAGPGVGLEVVCPDWVRHANWDKVEESEFDAVTRPTPGIGSHAIKFDCLQRKIVPASYRYCVQAHIAEDFNILYRGKILVGQDASDSVAEVFFSPRKHPMASDILSDVRARYIPEHERNPLMEKAKP